MRAKFYYLVEKPADFSSRMVNKNLMILDFNRSSRRKRGMASDLFFIIQDFFLHFPNELCYGYLRLEGNGKIHLGR